MFRDDRQTNRALAALLSTLPRLRGLWTDRGPSKEARELIDRGGGSLSREERVLLLVAADIWGGRGGARFAEVWSALGAEVRIALGQLMVAAARGAEAVDGWIVAHAGPESHEPRDEAPAALVDALIVAAIGRLASKPGDRVPLTAVRAELAALSDDAVRVALLDAERRGAIVLEANGDAPPDDAPPDDAAWRIQRGERGVLCWVRTRGHDA